MSAAASDVLKRKPIMQVGNELFIGNSKAAVQGAQEALNRA